MNAEIAIRFEGVSKRFGDLIVLDDVSFNVFRGQATLPSRALPGLPTQVEQFFV